MWHLASLSGKIRYRNQTNILFLSWSNFFQKWISNSNADRKKIASILQDIQSWSCPCTRLVAGVTFSDSNPAPVPKFLNPVPAIFQIWESDSCSDSDYNHRSNRNLPMFLLKKWLFSRDKRSHIFQTPTPLLLLAVRPLLWFLKIFKRQLRLLFTLRKLPSN